jgi:hypothetical protein
MVFSRVDTLPAKPRGYRVPELCDSRGLWTYGPRPSLASALIDKRETYS